MDLVQNQQTRDKPHAYFQVLDCISHKSILYDESFTGGVTA